MVVGDEVGTEDGVDGLQVGHHPVVLHLPPKGIDEVVIDCLED